MKPKRPGPGSRKKSSSRVGEETTPSARGRTSKAHRKGPSSRAKSSGRGPKRDVGAERAIMKLLGGKSYRPSNVPELLRSLGRPRSDQQELQETLAVLEKEGRIVRTKGNRYIEAREADLVSGVIQMTRGGRGFVQPDEAGADEISIPERFTGTAMHGDRVLVRRDVRPAPLRRGRKVVDEDAGGPVRSGSVVRILERKRSRMVGTLQEGQRILFVIPDDPRLSHNILVPPPRDVGRRPNPGDKVVVELTSWENRHTNPEGEIVEVLGPPDQEGVDMLSVLRQYDLPLSFPKVVLAEAKSISGDGEVDEADFKGRRDCREDLVITIDPDDAKDFDDAISVRRVGQDRWKLWVHIADVSHYVRPGSALDQEAEARGNSTYLVDRVIPMLPEALSNELCSLKPNVDRLTKCVEFDLDSAGGVLDAKFYPAVIHSKRRFSYQEALAVIEGKAADAAEKMILMAHQLAQKLRRARFKNGSLDLDFPESKIRLDDRGRVTRIDRMDNDVSHQLIEEFMLLANEAVAARLMQMPGNAVYRIHEAPKPERLAEYREQVLAHHVPCGNLERRDEIQKLLKRLSAIPIGGALKIGFLRSLTRARYAMEPLGHFGLAKEKYTHFTSPIRRYADLIVHRVLFEKTKISGGEMKRLSDHISTTERNSADAERDSRDVKLYAFLESQMDRGQLQVYSALVTEVRNFGFFIDVTELGMSGLVHLSSVADDFFDFDPIRLKLVGRQSGREILLGDHVDVQVCRIDRFKKQVDFQLVSEAPAPRGRRPVRKRPQDAERKAGMKGRRRGPQRGKRSRR